MSKLLANQISNYNDNGPVEVKDGLNIPTGKPLQVAGGSGTSGQYLTSTGSSIAWSTLPTIPAAQVQTDWNASGTIAEILNKPTLATVATSGSYTDLLNTPTIPSAQVQSDWNASGTLAEILNKPTLFSGSYNDLTNKPTIPSAPTQADWSQTDNTKLDFIENKPTIPTNLADLANVSSTAPNNNEVLKWNGTNWAPATDATGGGATVTTDDSAPGSPSDGDLWWKSDEGRLKVYYADANSSQWVDASPPSSLDLTAFTGHILPATHDQQDIGSANKKIRDLYLGSNSLHLGTVDITESGGKLVLPAVEMTGHFIPDTNAAYDLGNAEYKIRHLFLSDNTMYFQGDFLKVAQHNSGGSAQSPSYLIPLAKLKDALNASNDYEAFKTAILAITDAT